MNRFQRCALQCFTFGVRAIVAAIERRPNQVEAHLRNMEDACCNALNFGTADEKRESK